MLAGFSLLVVLSLTGRQAPAPTPAPSQTPAQPPVRDVRSLNGFKVSFRELDVAGRLVHNGELIVVEGRWYRVRSTDNEVVIVDTVRSRIEVLDLARKIQTAVPFDKLDERTELLKKTLFGSIAKREAKGDRANRVAAQMARELTDPKFTIIRDPSGRSAKLVNPTVQIEVKGEPDENAERIKGIGFALVAYAKFEAMRDPTQIPPFPKLDAYHELSVDLKLRPTEIVYVYRMTGKPTKQRWVYEFVPTITDRERSAVARIIEAQSLAKPERFEVFSRVGK